MNTNAQTGTQPGPTRCRLCGSASFGPVLDLGPMPLVNNLLETPDADCPRWPLEVVRCRDCGLVQLTETIDPESMFREYRYFSSQARTMVAHAGRLVARFVEPGQRVLEIASNDGYLLRHALDRGAEVLGVEPARNVAAWAEKHGIPTRCAFFDRSLAASVVETFGAADVLFAINVLAHVPDPHEIAAGIEAVLAPAGVAHIEVPYLVQLVDACAFDTIYHEHYCYFTVGTIRALFARHGLRVTGVEAIPIHGGSVHVRIARAGDEAEADAWCAREHALGVGGDGYYADFADRVTALRTALRTEIETHETVGAYGAAAKGIVLLNAFGLDTASVPWVADASPHKQGRFVPGTGQPIVPPSMLTRTRPDACLLLPWNLRAEIVERNRAYLEAGGRFIVAVPEVAEIAATPLPLGGVGGG